MFRGEPVNTSEGRPALHVALRMPRSRSLVVDGVDVVKEVHSELDRMSAFAELVRSGEWMGATGGRSAPSSTSGSAAATSARRWRTRRSRPHASRELAARFVSNVDPADLAGALAGLEPAETLFVVVSKTMSTLETIENARAARAWLAAALGPGRRSHAALRRRRRRPGSRGAHRDPAREHVPHLGLGRAAGRRSARRSGSRCSSRSATSSFRALLDGSHAMDDHFATAALGGNLPVICGLLAVWYRNFMGAETTAVVPYSDALRLFPAYLQQLWMESNGKSVTTAGEPAEVDVRLRSLGRRGHQRPARVLPAAPPGNGARARRPDRLRTVGGGVGGAARPARREPPRAGRGARVRADGRRARGGGRAGGDDPAPRHAGQPAELGASRRAADSGDARRARRALRAQRVHAGGDLGNQPVRPVGRRAREGARLADRAGARGGLEARAPPRLVHECA